MRGSLVFSVLGHSALLGWVLFTIQTQTPPRMPEPEPLAVDLVTPGDVTRLKQGVRTAKELEAQPKESPKSEPAKKEAEKPRPVATAPPPEAPPPPPPEEPKSDPIADKVASAPPPPPPAAAPPVPSPEEQKKLDDMLKAQEEARRVEQEQEAKRIEEQKRREEQKKQAELKKKKEEDERKRQAELKKKKEEERKRKEAEAKKKQDDEFKKISALLNKMPDKGAPPPPSDPTTPSQKRGPTLGAPEGRDRQLSASELAILGQIIKSCVQSKWSVMGGGEGAQHVQVKIRLRFNPDGRLAAAPTVMNPQNTPFFLAVSDSALRAVAACEPYPLPADKYDVWKDIVLNFDPRDMF